VPVNIRIKDENFLVKMHCYIFLIDRNSKGKYQKILTLSDVFDNGFDKPLIIINK